MSLKNKLFFVFCLFLITINAEKTVITKSTKENDETGQQNIQSDDPTVSAKFQTGNARFGVGCQHHNNVK